MKISDYFKRYKQIIDLEDLKIKFLINQYKLLSDFPEPDDLLYTFYVKNKKSISFEEFVKNFELSNNDKLNSSLSKLVEMGFLVEESNIYSLN
jgi:hypothetical protein